MKGILMKFFSICLVWLSICNLTYSMDRNAIFTNDELQPSGQDNFRYPQGIDPSFFSTETGKALLNHLNSTLEFEHRKITLEEDEDELRLIINRLETSNENNGHDDLVRLKTIVMPKSQEPVEEGLNRGLIRKRLRELSDLARKPANPEDSFSFSQKMDHQWARKIKPAITHGATSDIAEVLTETVIINLINPFIERETTEELELKKKSDDLTKQGSYVEALLAIRHYKKTTEKKQSDDEAFITALEQTIHKFSTEE